MRKREENINKNNNNKRNQTKKCQKILNYTKERQTYRDVIGLGALPIDDRDEGLHHAARYKCLSAGLVAGQVVEEREEGRGQGGWEGVGRRGGSCS